MNYHNTNKRDPLERPTRDELYAETLAESQAELDRLVSRRLRRARYDMAMEEYFARKDKRSHPWGSRDAMGRWHPADIEKRLCCEGPHKSLLRHCYTVEHIASLYDLNADELRSWIEHGRFLSDNP